MFDAHQREEQTEMISIRELLKDPEFKKFFTTVPRFRGHTTWWVYLQVDGKWKRKKCETYREAYAFFRRMIPRATDGSITSRAIAFRRPLDLRIKMEMPPGHDWCLYCRRPVEFRLFGLHHAIPRSLMTYVPRCSICGITIDGGRENR